MLPPMAPTSDPTSARSGGNSGLRITSGLPLTEDPFIDARKTKAAFRRSKRPTLEDTLIPDYSTERSQAYSDMTGLSFERKKDAGATTLVNNDMFLDELIHTSSPENTGDILTEACTPSKRADNGIQVPTNSPSSNAELSTWPSIASQELSLGAAVNTFDRNVEQEVSTRSTPSSHDSPGPTEASLSMAVIMNARPASSVRGKKKPAMALKNSLQSRGASFEVVRSTSTSFKAAGSSVDVPVLVSSDTKKARLDSSGSKRKRSTPSTPTPATGEAEASSPARRLQRRPKILNWW
jgi:hypothetical protein